MQYGKKQPTKQTTKPEPNKTLEIFRFFFSINLKSEVEKYDHKYYAWQIC